MNTEQFEAYQKELRMYVLVRRDVLPLVHCGVQAAHAVAEYVHYHDNDNTRTWVEQHKTLIVLSATADEIEEMRNKFLDSDMNYQPFYEPDMDNTLTAMAFQPVTTKEGSLIFNRLELVY